MSDHIADKVIITGAGNGFGRLVAEMTAAAHGAVVYVIDQPWGISISDITVRASGDDYVY